MTDRIRLVWKTLRDSESAVWHGPWYENTPKKQIELERSAIFANRHHGQGTHWVEVERKDDS